jgi:hypothetical protein
MLTGTKDEQASLANLAGGAAIEAFDYQFRRILENCVDPNASDKARSVTLKVSIKPGKENRSICSATFDVRPSFAPMKSFGATLYVAKNDHGEVEAREFGDTERIEFPEPEREDPDGSREQGASSGMEDKAGKLRTLYSTAKGGAE